MEIGADGGKREKVRAHWAAAIRQWDDSKEKSTYLQLVQNVQQSIGPFNWHGHMAQRDQAPATITASHHADVFARFVSWPSARATVTFRLTVLKSLDCLYWTEGFVCNQIDFVKYLHMNTLQH